MRCRLLAILILITCGAFAQAAETRPNIVLVLADDVSWNDIGAYGHPHIRTPHLDRLAQEGMRFDQAFLTCSSCSPSRASILTGRYPHSTGAGELHQPLPADQVVFAGLLKDSGYYTAAAGKWHLGGDAKRHFDRVAEGGRPSGCEHWVEVLQQRPQDQPFFLWLAAYDAHRDYAPDAIPQPHTADDAVVPAYLPDTPTTRKDLARYYDEITRLDSYAGKVMAELEQQGVLDNTLVLFMSDNGRPFPRCKTTLYDSGVQTPLIIRWPARVKAGAICESLVSSVDLAPTLLELAGLNIPDSFQGKSFARLLTEPAREIREHVFAEHNWHDYQAHQRSARSRKYLYIRDAFPELPQTPPADAVRSPTYREMIRLNAAGKLTPAQQDSFITPRPQEELYDVQADSYSLCNLANESGHQTELQSLRSRLDQWIAATDDRIPESPTPDKWDRTSGQMLNAKR